MDIPLLLAGSFGELRSNHFHTGIDIKTYGKEGYKIYAAADGYVSRINVSHWGYGKAIYITHPNGYTTVYAHLSEFNEEINKFIRKAQKDKQRETITIYPGKDQLTVKKGVVVALSGNSGHSTAPHLHFEIRETTSELPVNPLLFGFAIKDDIPPVINGIKIYPLTDHSEVMGEKSPKVFSVSGYNGKYTLNKDVVEVYGEVGIAINTIDKFNGTSNECGIYTIDLKLDSQKVFSQKMEKLDFFTNRYINAHMDYLAYKYDRESFHKSFKCSNNLLPIYSDLKNDGRVRIVDSSVQKVSYKVTDVYGNISTLQFKLQGQGKELSKRSGKKPGKLMVVEDENIFETEDLALFLPRNTLYEDLYFQYRTSDTINGAITPLYVLHDDDIPVHHYYTLKIKTGHLPVNLRNKALVVSVSSNGKSVYSKRGYYNDGWVITSTRSFGNYTVMIDSLPPHIEPINIYEGANMKYKKIITFKITDNLSGLLDYKVFIDGHWVYSEYDFNHAKLSVPLDEINLNKGDHELELKAVDERGNADSYKVKFSY